MTHSFPTRRSSDLCTSPVEGATPYTTTTETVVTAERNESQCSALAGDANCTLDTEVCTDRDPVTRIVDGVAVPQPCWDWQRSYTCSATLHGNDGAELEPNRSCRYTGTAQVGERVCQYV